MHIGLKFFWLQFLMTFTIKSVIYNFAANNSYTEEDLEMLLTDNNNPFQVFTDNVSIKNIFYLFYYFSILAVSGFRGC